MANNDDYPLDKTAIALIGQLGPREAVAWAARMLFVVYQRSGVDSGLADRIEIDLVDGDRLNLRTVSFVSNEAGRKEQPVDNIDGLVF